MNERSIFLDALDKADPRLRKAFLDTACAGDAAMRQRVEALLQSHFGAGDFLDKLAPERMAEELAQHTDDVTQGDTPGDDKSENDLSFLRDSANAESLGRLGHYEILEVIGRGGMGTVLRAFDEKLHRVVAIKVMAPALAATSPPRKRFLREARAAAAVRHEHVVDIHQVEEQPIPYLVMEYVAGETLQQKLDRIGPLEVPEVLRLGQQIARGLAAAHEKGLIHRDIKPSNILLEKGAEERVKITDFGLARAVADASLTQSGVIAGTPMYMAPEQTVGDTIDHRADLFSLGSVLYTMCSGRPPFRATTSMATLRRVAEDTPRPIREIIPEVPEWLVGIIAKLHAKKPDERFQSAKEVADLLGQYLAHLAHPALVPIPSPLAPLVKAQDVADAAQLAPPSAPLEESPSEVKRRRQRRWPVAATILLLLLGGLSLTEATGVTNVRATVIRIFTPDGTLVVEVDDPGVKVTIEGDGGIVITGAGPQEVRLRPGSYKLHADRDGKKVPLERELISIAKGGREVVRVKLEAPSVVAKADKGAFVVLNGKGVEAGKFETLSEAVKKAASGDTIEVRGNGPFLTEPLDLGLKALTIRAGSGHIPVIKPSLAAMKSAAPLLNTRASLTVEGLELYHHGLLEGNGFRALISSHSAPLSFANCKLVINRGKDVQVAAIQAIDASRLEIRNCLIVSWTYGFLLYGPRMGFTADNCLLTSQIAVSPDEMSSPRAKFRLTRNTICDCYVCVGGPADPLADQLRDPNGKPVVPVIIEAEESICQAGWVFYLNSVTPKHPEGLPVEEQRRAIAKMFHWRERGNVYGLGKEPFLRLSAPSTGLLKDLNEWNQFWGLKDTGSVQGSVLLRGNPQEMVAKTPESITPDDFRLRPDSAGYQAGKDKKDLGADVDLVGPGAAYERWKKTPEYWQWLRETGQLRAEISDAEPKAFVLLRAKGAAERKFDTLAEAVKSAASGDTIEIRGNGPFISPPVRMEKRALTIRAGEGFRPSIWLAPDGTTVAGFPEDEALLETDADLTIEGLELRDADWRRRPGGHTMVFARGPALRLLGCRLQLLGWGTCLQSFNRILEARNCEFLSQTAAAAVGWNGEKCLFDNCLIVTAWPGMMVGGEGFKRASARLTRNTVLGHGPAIQFIFTDVSKTLASDEVLRLETADNVFASPTALWVEQHTRPEWKPAREAEAEALLRRLVAWSEKRNVYAPGAASVKWTVDWQPEKKHGPATLPEWDRYWKQTGTGSLEAGVSFAGGDLPGRLASAPLKLTPADFRLSPDSAGYQKGEGKKDLGADVDLVGPGAAYERWKKTPEYQQWLKDSGQMK